MCYMLLLKLKRALVIVVNKNDDERYYERIEADNAFAKDLIRKGEDIIMTNFPPQKIGGASWYQCKWCDYYDICQFGGDVLHNCRTCHYSEVCDDGIWWCNKKDLEIDLKKQRIGCNRFELLHGLA